jgi:hypothetical protein
MYTVVCSGKYIYTLFIKNSMTLKYLKIVLFYDANELTLYEARILE